jgi:hypothetical protein
MNDDLTARLRLLASYHLGRDLAERFATAERQHQEQRMALAEAADEIERLRARVKELEAA